MEKKCLNFNDDPIERLEVEEMVAKSFIEKSLGQFLHKKFQEDKVLANCYKERKITLEDIADYVTKCAEKKLNGQNGAIEDSEVYGWAIHYIQDEKVIIRQETTKEIVTNSLSEAEKEQLNKKAQEEYLEEQKKKLEEKQKAKIKKEKKKLEESGQMTLFDL